MGEALIVSASESAYSRHPTAEQTTPWLLADAARMALDSAGLNPRDVDGLGVASFSLTPDGAVDLAWRLGLRLRWIMDSRVGGASAVDLIQHARRAIEAGDASTVLLVAGDRIDPPDFVRLVDTYNTATRDHVAAIPTGGPNALFAMLTRRHMERFGIDRDVYGGLVIAQRAWASLNPGAVYRNTLSIGEYLASPIVVEPLSQLDCVPVVAGANSIVMVGSQSALPSRGNGVRVRSLVALHNRDSQDGDGLKTGLAECGLSLWNEAGLEPAEMDIVSVYDDYPAMALVQLDELGFVSEGLERFVAEEIATRKLPVNTSGGQLSAGQAGAAGGMHGVVEIVRQLLGEAGGRQVQGARFGLVSGYGMVAYRYGACSNAVVLEAVR